MNSSELLYQRLHNQKLSSSEFKKPAEVVRWLGAVQAQEFNDAKWALALRMHKATNAGIEEAYNDGKILRTHVMRPTWHFVIPGDIRWLLQLTAPRVIIRCDPYNRKLELDAATFKRSNKALTNALQGGKHLTRRALRTVLNQSGVAVNDTVRLAHILLRAEVDGVICSGPLMSNQFTYALFDERVPPMKPLDRDEALARLTRRYFTSHGPATLQDFSWWSGLTVADARRGLTLVDRHLREAVLHKKVHWSPRSIQTKRRPNQATHILPAFDEYLVAYKDRQTVLSLSDSKPLLTMQASLGPTVIIDGRTAGTWKRSNDKNTLTIAVRPLRPLNNSERLAIRAAADRYAAFLCGSAPSALKLVVENI